MLRMGSALCVHDGFFYPGGAERVTLLLRDIFHADLIVLGLKGDTPFPVPKENLLNLNTWRENMRNSQFVRLLNMIRSLRALRTLNYHRELLICSGMLAVYARKNPGSKKVIYMHSPPRDLYDLRQFISGRHKGISKLLFYLYVNLLELLDQKWIREADLIICNSRTIQQRIRRYYQRESIVIYPVSRDGFYFNKVGSFFLLVSRLEDRKRVELAIRTFKEIPYETLIIVGSGSLLEKQRYYRMIEGARNIELLTDIPDERLFQLYADCKATLHLAMFEDFGLTVQESFKSGKPAIVLDDGEGLVEQIDPDFNGLIIREPYFDGLKTAVRKWDPQRWDYHGIRSHGRQYSVDKFREEILSAVRKIYPRLS